MRRMEITDLTGIKFEAVTGDECGIVCIERGGELVDVTAIEIDPESKEDRALWRAASYAFYAEWPNSDHVRLILEEADLFSALLAEELGRDTFPAFRFKDGEWVDDVETNLEAFLAGFGFSVARFAINDFYRKLGREKK